MLYKSRIPNTEPPEHIVPPMGCTAIQLRFGCAQAYVDLGLKRSNTGWHPSWFYVNNYAEGPLPEFSGQIISEVPWSWGDGSPKKNKRRLSGLLATIAHLK